MNNSYSVTNVQVTDIPQSEELPEHVIIEGKEYGLGFESNPYDDVTMPQEAGDYIVTFPATKTTSESLFLVSIPANRWFALIPW